MITTIALVAFLASFILFIFLLYNSDTMKSVYLPFLSLAILFYMLGNYVEVSADTVNVAVVGLRIRYFGVPFVPTIWYLCVREFCGQKFGNRYEAIPFLLIPTVLSSLVFSWESNHLLISAIGFLHEQNYGNLHIVEGPLARLKYVYQYGIDILGLFTLVSSYRKGTKRFKKQAILFIISIFVPIFATATFVVRSSFGYVDVTPYGMLFSMFLFVIAIYRLGVLNLSGIIKENAMQHLYEGILLFDSDGIYMDSNQSAKEIFPRLETVALGTSIDDMDYLPFDAKVINADKKTDSHVSEFTREYNSVIKTFSVSISKIYRNRAFIGYSIILNNISPLKKVLLDLKEKSITDPLTNIYNRGYLFEVGKRYMEDVEYKSKVFSIIMIDIDHFKNVNDSYGHVFGDYVLKTMAMLCAASLRESDFIARYGGEEFCVLLFDAPVQAARDKAEQLRLKISSFVFESDNVKTALTASFGVASYTPNTGQTFVDIIKVADENLYTAKETGRNKVC